MMLGMLHRCCWRQFGRSMLAFGGVYGMASCRWEVSGEAAVHSEYSSSSFRVQGRMSHSYMAGIVVVDGRPGCLLDCWSSHRL